MHEKKKRTFTFVSVIWISSTTKYNKKKTTTDTSILSEVAGPDWNGLNS